MPAAAVVEERQVRRERRAAPDRDERAERVLVDELGEHAPSDSRKWLGMYMRGLQKRGLSAGMAIYY